MILAVSPSLSRADDSFATFIENLPCLGSNVEVNRALHDRQRELRNRLYYNRELAAALKLDPEKLRGQLGMAAMPAFAFPTQDDATAWKLKTDAEELAVTVLANGTRAAVERQIEKENTKLESRLEKTCGQAARGSVGEGTDDPRLGSTTVVKTDSYETVEASGARVWGAGIGWTF